VLRPHIDPGPVYLLFWVRMGARAALTPLSVDGMIVAASTKLLAESRSGTRGGFLPRALLVVGSVASLAANVAVAEPRATGRVVAAWPSFALIASYELLMCQVRRHRGWSVRCHRPWPPCLSCSISSAASTASRVTDTSAGSPL
jgi:hypothetical protein